MGLFLNVEPLHSPEAPPHGCGPRQMLINGSGLCRAGVEGEGWGGAAPDASLSSALKMLVPYEYGALGKSTVLGSNIGICLCLALWSLPLWDSVSFYLNVDKNSQV